MPREMCGDPWHWHNEQAPALTNSATSNDFKLDVCQLCHLPLSSGEGCHVAVEQAPAPPAEGLSNTPPSVAEKPENQIGNTVPDTPRTSTDVLHDIRYAGAEGLSDKYAALQTCYLNAYQEAERLREQVRSLQKQLQRVTWGGIEYMPVANAYQEAERLREQVRSLQKQLQRVTWGGIEYMPVAEHQEQVRSLTEALCEFGTHTAQCATKKPRVKPLPCDCGFEAALEQVAGKEQT
jgi:cell fate (sporulation/competence/biofilm development) regulator YlbF (YheA/YmcA/DUF963 family)